MLTADQLPALLADHESDRLGPSRRAANQQEERLLSERRTASQKTFDARPCGGCTMDDLVRDLFLVSYLPAAVTRDVIEENDRDHAPFVRIECSGTLQLVR